jgi:hypothetical protein
MEWVGGLAGGWCIWLMKDDFNCDSRAPVNDFEGVSDT